MRRLAVILLDSLAALGGVDFAMRAGPAAGKRAGFTVSGGYPLTLPRGRPRLGALVPDPAAWPQVSMHDLPPNQDACKAGRLSLDYGGPATR